MTARTIQIERRLRRIALAMLLTFVIGHILGGSLHEHCCPTETRSPEIGHCQAHGHEEPKPTQPIPTDSEDDCDACILASLGHASPATDAAIVIVYIQSSIASDVVQTEILRDRVLSATDPSRGPPAA